MTLIPKAVDEVIDILAAMPGAVAVVLGGSRAVGTEDAASDWDLGVYYRGEIDLPALSELGTVFLPSNPPCSARVVQYSTTSRSRKITSTFSPPRSSHAPSFIK